MGRTRANFLACFIMIHTADPSTWLDPPADVCMETQDVHIWRAADIDAAAENGFLYPLLDSKEQARAAGFKFEHDRTRFIFCRGLLRQLLGRYSGESPGDITFAYGPFGKPSIASGSSVAGGPPLHFNVSHTKGLALFAFSASMEVGIDVEAIESAHDWQTTARRFFHPNEWALLESKPPSAKARTGYLLWTCKEAYLKASGEGVGGGLEAFEVIPPASIGGEARINLPKDSENCATYLRSLEVGTGFAAALAVLGRPSRLRTWNLHFR